MPAPRLEVLPDAEAASRRGAELIAEAAVAAIAQRGRFTLAVSGGTEPWRMFRMLGELDPDWARIDVFQVDERVVADDDPDRNLAHLRASLPAAAQDRVHPMPVPAADLDAAADAYAAELPECFDLIHLGLGPDGHTASLVPGDPVLEVTDRRVALTGVYQSHRRMTLTYPVLDGAQSVFWLAPGTEKREPVAKLLAGDESIPAARVRARDAVVICDRAAAG